MLVLATKASTRAGIRCRRIVLQVGVTLDLAALERRATATSRTLCNRAVYRVATFIICLRSFPDDVRRHELQAWNSPRLCKRRLCDEVLQHESAAFSLSPTWRKCETAGLF